MLTAAIKKVFSTLGYRVEKLRPETGMTMFEGLARCKARGTNVRTVIDVGASDGSWSRECLRYFPDAQYLMVEAQEPHRPGLQKLSTENKNVDFIVAAAGKKDGTIYFDNTALFGGLASEEKLEGECIEVPVISIDSEILRRNLKGPYLVKLDTHGFEVPILEGAQKALQSSSLVIIETYNFQLTASSLRFFEMCDYMKRLGFLPVEMVDFVLRKYDGAFWQMDTFFVPATNKEFNHQSFD
jgi:FkbM family methyltransferase